VAFRKADESLVFSDKNLTICWHLHYYVQKQEQLLSHLSLNKCTVSLQFLNKSSAMIFFLFSSTLLISLNSSFICVVIFLSLRSTFYFTNPDYSLIRVTSPPNYFELPRVYCVAPDGSFLWGSKLQRDSVRHVNCLFSSARDECSGHVYGLSQSSRCFSFRTYTLWTRVLRHLYATLQKKSPMRNMSEFVINVWITKVWWE
jgi:hypothetical protein